MTKTLYIGIDPGTNTGIAIWHKPSKQLALHQFKSHGEAMLFVNNFLNKYYADDKKQFVQLRIEDARKAKRPPDPTGAHNARLQGVGAVKAYSKDWEAFCKTNGYDHEMLAPGKTKVSPTYFQAMTGIKTLKGQSHIRDAGMLVYGI